MKILLTVAYDGTNYAGWQRQENAISVQQSLEEALANLLGQPIKLSAASRTDAGVHALGQKAAFLIEHMPIPLDRFPQALNKFTADDIVVREAKQVSDEFNPRFDAKHKTYRYQIYNARLPSPLERRYSAFVPRHLDTEKMRQAAKKIVGTHDFAAFCAAGSSAKTTVRTIFDCDITKNGDMIQMLVSGNAFLYNMVRIIAGTLVYIGMGKIEAEDISNIIASKDRPQAGKTMPPEGLTLMDIFY